MAQQRSRISPSQPSKLTLGNRQHLQRSRHVRRCPRRFRLARTAEAVPRAGPNRSRPCRRLSGFQATRDAGSTCRVPAATAETTVAGIRRWMRPKASIAEEAFTVSVALTEEQLTPDVTARAAPTTTSRRKARSNSRCRTHEEWPIDIDLLAAGFDLADGGKWSRRVTLYRYGDSDFARFELKARNDSRRASRGRSWRASTMPGGSSARSPARSSVLREARPAPA